MLNDLRESAPDKDQADVLQARPILLLSTQALLKDFNCRRVMDLAS